MNTCKNCGGSLVSNGSGRYRCKYCGHEFTDDDFKTAKEQAFVKPRANEGVDVYSENVNGVLEITCTFKECISSGSGLLVSGSGFAVTNAHVVTYNYKPCENISVKIAGSVVKADIVALGDNKGGQGDGVDLALIRLRSVPFGAKPIVMENFENVKIGEQVFVIGNSLGDGTCITSGIVSDKCRVLNGHKLLMTDCAINGGNSGGPIFNSRGLAIGVIVSSRLQSDGSPTEGMNYAIPSFIVEEFIDGDHCAVRFTGGNFR